MKSSFSLPGIFLEVVQNLCAPRSRRFLLLIVVSTVAFVAVLQVRADWQSLQAESEALEAAGWGVYTLASTEQAVSAERCRSAASLSGVVRAGAVQRLDETVTPAGILSPTIVDSALLARILNPDSSAIVSSAFLAANPDLRLIWFRGVPWRLVQGGPSFDALELGAVVVFPDTIIGAVETCIFELNLSWTTYNDMVVPSLLGWDGPQPQVSSDAILSPGEHPYRRFLERSTRHLPLVAGIGTGILYLFVGIALRSQMSVYRVVGYGRASLLTYYLAEIVVLAAVGTSLGAIATWWIEANQLFPIGSSGKYLLSGAVSFVVTAATLSPILVTGSVLDQLKDR